MFQNILFLVYREIYKKMCFRIYALHFERKIFKRPKNCEERSDFDDFRTKWIASKRPILWKNFEQAKKETNKLKKQTNEHPSKQTINEIKWKWYLLISDVVNQHVASDLDQLAWSKDLAAFFEEAAWPRSLRMPYFFPLLVADTI